LTEKKASKTGKQRTQVKELPKREQELSKEEQKKIKGGPTQSSWLPAMRNGSTGGST
jgi:hypothetical protein